MSDEKRQTRLLPFRLRRRPAPDAERDFPADAELRELLRAWEAPQASARSRERLLADFRAHARRAPLWRRALRAELRVPLPVAACALVALLSLLAFAARSATRTQQSKAVAPDAANVGPAPTSGAAQTSDATGTQVSDADGATNVKVVEVPVVRERVVTRIVYVEKKERLGARPGAALAAERERRARDGEQASGAASSYFTRVDMEDFQPADEMKIRIVRKGKGDEK
ncbi:MAG: hypothetical protein M3444_22790 [Acidobacteriota bacterium]|nr:hypothetical protein [Acidobacteriota bacterium]MDQ5839199.1 hypothetical protein [Acidobacteriota bacterium]